MALNTVNDYIDAKLTHSVHTSGAKSFRGCRRRWNWLFNDYWYPKTTVKPLEFGVAFHKAAEVLYDPLLWNKPTEVVKQLARVALHATIMAQRKAYYEAFPGEEPEIEADYTERLELGYGMIGYWLTHGRQKDIDEGFKPLQVEISFEIPITGPNGETLWCRCDSCWDRFKAYKATKFVAWQIATEDNLKLTKEHWQGLPVSYGGRIDCIMEGPDGRIWIVDWKTAAQLSIDREEFLQLDDQIKRYCAALRKLGYRVAGFLYHEVRKAVPLEPEPLTRPYKGCIYSQNKQNPVEYDTYKITVKENDAGAYSQGLYNNYLQYLLENPQRFSARFPIYCSDKELDSVEMTMWDEACDMMDPNIRIYPNAGRFNCTNCAFRIPCLETNSQRDVEYTLATLFDKRRYHYWEDKKPSTDSKGNE